jgi:hypothetical protein
MAPKAVDARKRSDWNRRGNAIENGLLSAEINPIWNDREAGSAGCVGPTPKLRPMAALFGAIAAGDQRVVWVRPENGKVLYRDTYVLHSFSS